MESCGIPILVVKMPYFAIFWTILVQIPEKYLPFSNNNSPIMSPGSTGIHNGIILRGSMSENEIVLLTPYSDALCAVSCR